MPSCRSRRLVPPLRPLRGRPGRLWWRGQCSSSTIRPARSSCTLAARSRSVGGEPWRQREPGVIHRNGTGGDSDTAQRPPRRSGAQRTPRPRPTDTAPPSSLGGQHTSLMIPPHTPKSGAASTTRTPDAHLCHGDGDLAQVRTDQQGLDERSPAGTMDP